MSMYMEDFQVGQKFVSPSRPLHTDEIIEFAMVYDNQPFHVDPEAAKTTFFKGHAASGWQIAAITFELLLKSGLDLAGGIIGTRIEELTWQRPVRPGDTLYAVTEVSGIEPNSKNPTRGTMRMRHSTFNQNDEQVFSMIASVLVTAHPT